MHPHRLILTLGTNTGSTTPIEMALTELSSSISILASSPTMRTPPIDFPYPSPDFLNKLLIASTTLSYEAMRCECKRIEALTGRTAMQRKAHPEVIPLDLDIIAWDGRLCKPRDFHRPYVLEGLVHLSESK